MQLTRPEQLEKYLAVEAKLALYRALRDTPGSVRVAIGDQDTIKPVDFCTVEVLELITGTPAEALPSGERVAARRGQLAEFHAMQAAACLTTPDMRGPHDLIERTRDGVVLTLPLNWQTDVEYTLNRDREQHVLFAASVYDAPTTWAQVRVLRGELMYHLASGVTDLVEVRAFAPDLPDLPPVTRAALATLDGLLIRHSWPHEVLVQLSECWHATTLADVLATLPRVRAWETQARLEAVQEALDEATDGLRMQRPELTRKGARAYLRDRIRAAYLEDAEQGRLWHSGTRTFSVPAL